MAESDGVSIGCTSDNHFWSAKNTLAHEAKVEKMLAAEIGKYDHFVFNGDTVDFEAARYSQAETMQRGLKLFDKFARANPATQIHFVLGNHDGTQAVYDAFRKLAQKLPNLHVHPVGARIGDALFLHGDRAHLGGSVFRNDKTGGNDSFRVVLPDGMPGLSEKAKRSVKTMMQLGLQTVADWGHPADWVVGELRNSFAKHPNPVLKGVTKVVTGHTHKPYTCEKDGITWYNTGATTPDARSAIVSFKVKAGHWTRPETIRAWQAAQDRLVVRTSEHAHYGNLMKKFLMRSVLGLGRRLGLTKRYPSGALARAAGLEAVRLPKSQTTVEAPNTTKMSRKARVSTAALQQGASR